MKYDTEQLPKPDLVSRNPYLLTTPSKNRAVAAVKRLNEPLDHIKLHINQLACKQRLQELGLKDP